MNADFCVSSQTEVVTLQVHPPSTSGCSASLISLLASQSPGSSDAPAMRRKRHRQLFPSTSNVATSDWLVWLVVVSDTPPSTVADAHPYLAVADALRKVSTFWKSVWLWLRVNWHRCAVGHLFVCTTLLSLCNSNDFWFVDVRKLARHQVQLTKTARR